MRLNSIKLSGFKSFAETTHFQLPGQLVGVVGPNGCGKSNIMDAVRWVLGESKASELRGESMQDVIFNGSGQRKPSSRASVELAFSNEDGRAGGQWNRFSDIAVKRVLTRDGTSSYYINNQPVRRRDVQDVFLGTGLGPRAYAIIGQGTISRIIESRPEELRLFLEEAAGVSKYKERRRETESRLKDTRDNLTRVDDILRELNSSLDKLHLQAAVASQYRDLQEQGTLRLHEFWFLKYRDATLEQSRVEGAVREAINRLESRMSELRHCEAELETLRQAHYAAGDALHSAQAALASAALEVSRLEERIRYVVQGRESLAQRLTEVQGQVQHWSDRHAADDIELAQVQAQLVGAIEHSELLAAQAQDQAANLPELEDALRVAQSLSNTHRDAVAQIRQQIQVLAAESRSAEEQVRQLSTRRQRLHSEQQQGAGPDHQRLSVAQAQLAQAQEAQAISEARLHELSEQLLALDEARRTQQALLGIEGGKQADLSAHLNALQTLQNKLQTQDKLQPWLVQQGLERQIGLWTQLHIEAGWETALESALRERMSALEITSLEKVCDFAADVPVAKLAFYASTGLGFHDTAPPAHGLSRLSDWLRLSDAHLKSLLTDWLTGVYAAMDLMEALALRTKLRPGEWIVTPQGHAVSASSVSFYAPDSEHSGLLARAQEIENLQRQLRAQSLIVDEARSAMLRVDAAYAEGSTGLGRLRSESSQVQAHAQQLKLEVLSLSQQLEHATQRGLQLSDELRELDGQLDTLSERCAVGTARAEDLELEQALSQERHAESNEAVLSAERHVVQAREQLRTLERKAQEAQFSSRALLARRGELERSIKTAVDQLGTHAQTILDLQAQQHQLSETVDHDSLDAALALRLDREAALGAARSLFDDVGLRLKQADELRLRHELSLQPLRDVLTQLQLDAQAAQLGGGQYLEQLNAAGVDLQTLGQRIEVEGVKLYGLQAEIDRLQREINALGAVNLAALDELSAARERKTFLDAQNADLNEAIHTLEDAIRKIDLETRDLLAHTFNQVNTHFGQLFPSLFGGGMAKLMMTGDEILDAGVQVMAQPPGKKNSTIHLLSGGEKALTAIALVFAIFQLNPAPFCLLDEVDAPLDDANTARYAKLVHTMSSETQFLFISHNKIAMEMAEQLIGVTMQEQGVSRIVAVDMQAAVRLAEVT